MSESERNLAADRANRNAARGLFDARLARVKGEVAEHGGLSGKIKDDLLNRAAQAGRQGLEIAADNKAVVGGTLAAVGLWFMRRPLLRTIRSWISGPDQPAEVNPAPARTSADEDQEYDE